MKIDAEVFVGGSYAKKTLMRKDDYDVDIFLRFDSKYDEKEIAKLAGKILSGFKGILVIHGSRDYYKLDINERIFFEIVPVVKVKNPKESNNITDLSYFHVNYINKKAKSKKLLDEIILAKKFCYANKCYGAESYIKGFSGYALELLVCYYGSFVKFVKAMANAKNQVVIDIEKHHKNKQAILMDLNSSKLQSPIILIDPTYKQRNALATLSKETFEKFKKVCGDFIKNPKKEAFEFKPIDFNKLREDARKKKLDFVLINAKTDRQTGDIAGSKLLKFYEHLADEIGKFFEIKKKAFEYDNKKSATYFLAVKKRKELLITGPRVNDEKNVEKFKKKHKKTNVKSGRVCAREKIDFGLKEFLEMWKKKNQERIKEMYITKVEMK